MISKEILDFPKAATKERPIPKEIWPDLPGVRTAKVVEWEPTLRKWKEFWNTAREFSLVSVDTETSGLRPFHGSKIVGVSAAFYDGKEIQAGYWNFRHCGHGPHEGCKGYKEKAVVIPVEELQRMVPVYQECIIVGQNFKYDIKMGYVDELPIPPRVLDTQLIAHLWDENARKYNLDTLASEMGEKKLGDTISAYLKEHGLTLEFGHAQVPFEVERPYAIADSVIVLRRLQYERERWAAAEDPRLMDVFQVENASTPAFSAMEIPGIRLDRDYARAGIATLEADIAIVEKKIYKEAKKKFGILSTQQLWQVLEARGLKPISLTPAGMPCLDDVNLEAYHDDFCNMIKEYRGKTKMLGTYFKAFLEDYVDDKGKQQKAHADPNGFIHSDFFIHGTVGGRSSSREPNLQNIPRFEKFGSRTKAGSTAKALHEGLKNTALKTGADLEVRRCFIPRGEDFSLFFFDYAQMELRVFADYAEEEFMLKELDRGVDIHGSVAREVFPNVPTKEENKVLYEYFRQLTKQINFGIIYGMGRNKLAIQLDVPVDETVRLLELVKAGFKAKLKMKSYTTLTPDDVEALLEDHRVMTQSRQWPGLRTIGKEVSSKVEPAELEKLLIVGDKNMRLMYSAQGFLDKYHIRFPKIKVFTKAIDKAIRARGFIFNRYGRRYHLPSDKTYVGVNRLIQGTCADMVKLAQWRIYKLLEARKAKTKFINVVHDEIQFDIHHSELDIIPEIKQCMETFSHVETKMKVDCDYSHISWANKRKWVDEAEFKASLEEHKKEMAAVKKPTSNKKVKA